LEFILERKDWALLDSFKEKGLDFLSNIVGPPGGLSFWRGEFGEKGLDPWLIISLRERPPGGTQLCERCAAFHFESLGIGWI
jgi:hypothetical protein